MPQVSLRIALKLLMFAVRRSVVQLHEFGDRAPGAVSRIEGATCAAHTAEAGFRRKSEKSAGNEFAADIDQHNTRTDLSFCVGPQSSQRIAFGQPRDYAQWRMIFIVKMIEQKQ